MTPQKSIVAKILLVFGLGITIAATPGMSTNNDNCKKAGQTNSSGQLACPGSELPCDITGESCRSTKWHASLGDPFIFFCSCSITGEFAGPDPTTGICMAYTIDTGTGQEGLCSTSGCTDPQVCKKESGVAWKKCICGTPEPQ
jgi:hypothetical protein